MLSFSVLFITYGKYNKFIFHIKYSTQYFFKSFITQQVDSKTQVIEPSMLYFVLHIPLLLSIYTKRTKMYNFFKKRSITILL